jgi:membrane-bound lytic murein transglycosylase D
MKFHHLVTLFFLITIVYSCQSEKQKVLVKEKIVSAKIFEYEHPLPDSVIFFNETIWLSDVDLNERLQREIASFLYNPYSLIGILKRSSRYFPTFQKFAKKNKIPTDIQYLAAIESNLLHVTSPVGAKGLWQIMESTGKQYQLRIDDEVDERLHTEKSTQAACEFLFWLRQHSDNWVNACASYNRGLEGLKSDLENQGVTHFFDGDLNNETARYVFRIMALKILYENPTKYGIELSNEVLYTPIKTQKISINKPINDLGQWAIERNVNLKILRKLNPWLISRSLTQYRQVEIELPTASTSLKPYTQYLR